MSAGVRIRPAGPEDAAACAALAGLCFPDPWPLSGFEDELENPDSVFLIAGESGAVSGFAAARCLAPEGELLDIAVSPGCRRQGMGAALLNAVLRGLAERGTDTVFLEVRASNAPAIALYAANGFTPCGRRKNYYTRPAEDAILMKRSL